MAHPVRNAITKLLSKKSLMYIQEIADALELNRKLVSFHLMVMEKEGLIHSELKLSSTASSTNPRAVRYVELTQKAKDIMARHSLV